jgi:hypothetical protein
MDYRPQEVGVTQVLLVLHRPQHSDHIETDWISDETSTHHHRHGQPKAETNRDQQHQSVHPLGRAAVTLSPSGDPIPPSSVGFLIPYGLGRHRSTLWMLSDIHAGQEIRRHRSPSVSRSRARTMKRSALARVRAQWDSRLGQSCRTTLNSELLILSGISPLYSMKPSFLNLLRKKFTRERVVPIMPARVSWEIFGTTRVGLSCVP